MAAANVDKSTPYTSSSSAAVGSRMPSTRDRKKPETFTAGNEGGVRTRTKSYNKEIHEVPDIIFPK